MRALRGPGDVAPREVVPVPCEAVDGLRVQCGEELEATMPPPDCGVPYDEDDEGDEERDAERERERTFAGRCGLCPDEETDGAEEAEEARPGDPARAVREPVALLAEAGGAFAIDGPRVPFRHGLAFA